MEKLSAAENSNEQIRQRRERLEDFVQCIALRRDSAFSFHCMVLHYPNLTFAQREDLVQIICDDQSSQGEEMAFHVLHKIPKLDERYRGALLDRIVASGDKTVCNETLLFVPDLGDWEPKLRHVLAS